MESRTKVQTVLEAQRENLLEQIHQLGKQVSQVELKIKKTNAFFGAQAADGYHLIQYWLDSYPDRGGVKAAYADVNEDGWNILDVAALHGRDRTVRRLKVNYYAKASKALLSPERYKTLTDEVREALTDIKTVPYRDPSTGEFITMEAALMKLISFNDQVLPIPQDVSLLEKCLQYDIESCRKTVLDYTTTHGNNVELSPIEYALKHADSQVIELLLRYGFTLPDGPMLVAGTNIHALRYLIAKGYGNDANNNSQVLSKIMTSTLNPPAKLTFIRELLKQPINPSFENQKRHHGWTLLDLAIWYSPECVEELCKLPGFSIDMVNAEGMTAFHRLFQKNNAKPNLSLLKNKSRCFNLLCKLNANPAKRDKSNQTPLDLAFKLGDHMAAYWIATYMETYKGVVEPENSLSVQLENIEKIRPSISIVKQFQPCISKDYLRERLDKTISKLTKLREQMNLFLDKKLSIKSYFNTSLATMLPRLVNELAILSHLKSKLETLEFDDDDNVSNFLTGLLKHVVLREGLLTHITAFQQAVNDKKINSRLNYLQQLKHDRNEIQEVVRQCFHKVKDPNLVGKFFKSGEINNNPILQDVAAAVARCPVADFAYAMVDDCVLDNVSDMSLISENVEVEDNCRKSLVASMLSSAAGSPIFYHRKDDLVKSGSNSSLESATAPTP